MKVRYLVVFIFGIFLSFIFLLSCDEGGFPLMNVSNAEKIIFYDCGEESGSYIIDKNDTLFELFFRNVEKTNGFVHESLRLHTGFVKVEIYMRDSTIHEIHIVKMIKSVPVVYFPSTGEKYYNHAMNDFFRILKTRFPNFNWCQYYN